MLSDVRRELLLAALFGAVGQQDEPRGAGVIVWVGRKFEKHKLVRIYRKEGKGLS